MAEAISPELERRVLHGLNCEWQAARDDLPCEYRELMFPPLFRLADLKRTWGQWSSALGEIVINRRLVADHSWDAVREVLRHEMAHQLATRILDGAHEPPHGPGFHRACRLLKANPRASGNYPPLDARLSGSPAAHHRDRLMTKVAKLLSLATSPHPQEAEAAMLKARQLTDKYNLEILDNHRPAGYLSRFLGQPALRHTRETYHLAHLLIRHYWVAGIWIPAFVLAKGKMGRVLEISGTPANLKSAVYVHDYIRRYIENQWQRYTRGRKLSHPRRIDFAVGIIQGFQSKLDEARRPSKSADPRRKALVLRSDPNLQAYLAHRYPRTQSVYRGARQMDGRVVADGIETGRRLVIAKGIETRKKGLGGLIATAD
ncbi:MAG: DUF2786 domain-containing protein [Desulfobacterales bacterium]